jgi:hypothetical protein
MRGMRRRRFLVTLIALLLSAILYLPGSSAYATSFRDVAGGRYDDAVRALVDIKVLTGFPDGTFRPEVVVTRMQMAAILVRALGLEAAATAAKGATAFTDISDTHWGSGYVNVAHARKIVIGYPDGTFRPEDKVTYAQAATMIVRALGRDAEATAGGAAWPTGHVSVAERLGLTLDTDFALGDAGATRGDVALMIRAAVYQVPDPATGKTLASQVHGITDDRAVRISLSTPAPIIANGASSQGLTATVLDAAGRVADNWSGTIRFSVKGASVRSASESVTAGAGRASVLLTSAGMRLTGPTIVTASAPGLAGASVTVTPQAPVPTSAQLVPGAPIGTTEGAGLVNVRVRILDQAGGEIAAEGVLGRIRVDNPNIAKFGVLAETDVDFLNGNTVNFLSAAGRVVVTASLQMSETNVELPCPGITVHASAPGVPYGLVIEPPNAAKAAGPDNLDQTVVMRVVDGQGKVVTSVGLSTPTQVAVCLTVTDVPEVSVTSIGGAKKLSGTSGPNVPGDAVSFIEGTVVFRVRHSRAATVSYEASGTLRLSSGELIPLTPATQTGTFTHGPPERITIDGSPRPSIIVGEVSLSADGSAGGILTATLQDANGNIVREGAYDVTFRRTEKGSAEVYATADWVDTQVLTVDGVATVRVKGTTHVTKDVFQAETVTPDGRVLKTPYPIAVATRVMGRPTSAIITGDLTARVGRSFTLRCSILDDNGVVVTTDSGRTITLSALCGGNFDQVEKTWTAATLGGIAIFSPILTDSGNHRFRATAADLTMRSSHSINIAPGTAVALGLGVDPDVMVSDGTSQGRILAYVLDKYGNRTSATGLKLRLSTSGAAPGSLVTVDRSTAYPADGVPVDLVAETPALLGYFRAGERTGTALVTASAAAPSEALGSSSASVRLVVGGAPSALRIIPPDSATLAGATQTVAVEVVDAAGQRVTSLITPLTGDSHALTIRRVGNRTGTMPGVNLRELCWEAGRVAFTTTTTLAQTFAYTASGSVLWKGTPKNLQTASESGVFKPAAAADLTWAFSPKVIDGDGTAESVATFTIVDRYGNQVPDAAGGARLSLSRGAELAHIVGAGEDKTRLIAVERGVGSVTVRAQGALKSGYVTLRASYKLPGGDAVTDFFGYGLGVRCTSDGITPVVMHARLSTLAGGSSWISVVFNEAVDATSATDPSNYRFLDLGTPQVTIKQILLSPEGDEVLIRLTGKPAAGFDLTIRAGIKDLAGNALPADVTLSRR